MEVLCLGDNVFAFTNLFLNRTDPIFVPISFLSNSIFFSSERERSPLKERNSNKYGSPSKQFGSPGKQSVASPGKLGSPNKRDVPITRSPAKHTQVGILLQSD